MVGNQAIKDRILMVSDGGISIFYGFMMMYSMPR